ncbi:ImmA/IrrE family metallo-endopeptidase [Peptacetobacter sp. AB800]|uniref:ImmA/IrrE family metallo-endopeptidase n=1 Tax=Peptacetobacter sp. AB800 TaxID=3388428 RepID=UPI0039FD097D
MTKFEQLLDIAEKENIIIKFVDEIPEVFAEALYISKFGIRMILMANILKSNTIRMTEVLAEELGHHFTSMGDNIEPKNYFDKVNIDKCEAKALRWACNFLVPKDELIDELKKRPASIDELADGLSVSRDILMQSFYYLSLNNEYLQIEDDEFLVLSNYPTLYIYNKF